MYKGDFHRQMPLLLPHLKPLPPGTAKCRILRVKYVKMLKRNLLIGYGLAKALVTIGYKGIIVRNVPCMCP